MSLKAAGQKIGGLLKKPTEGGGTVGGKLLNTALGFVPVAGSSLQAIHKTLEKKPGESNQEHNNRVMNAAAGAIAGADVVSKTDSKTQNMKQKIKDYKAKHPVMFWVMAIGLPVIVLGGIAWYIVKRKKNRMKGGRR